MAQVDAFLKLEGIKGESSDSKHTNEIEILNWSWGMQNAGSGHYGAGSGAGKVQVSDINIVKRVDTASPMLMKSCAKGDHIKSGVLVVRKAGGDQLEYFKVELTDILVSGIQCHSDPGSPQLLESVNLNFRTFKVTYLPQKESGGAGAPSEFGYDLAAGKPI
jgi:type VI secretion system secreted protein Hcp